MSERDVLDGLRGMCNTIDYALASGVTPAYPDTSIRSVIGRAADALAESLAEVDRLRQAVDDAVHLYHQALEERDEALAAIARVRELHEPLECPCGTCDVVICAECLSEAHPCPTIRALDGGKQS